MSEQAGFLFRLRVALITGAYAALLLAAIAALALLFHQPWLFPSLGPSIYLHVLTPDRPGALPGHTFGGHLLALAVGMLSVYLTGAAVAPPVTAGNAVTEARALAAVLAVFLILAIIRLLKVSNPAASATALLVALGGITPGWQGGSAVVVGAGVIAVLGEGVRRRMLRFKGMTLG